MWMRLAMLCALLSVASAAAQTDQAGTKKQGDSEYSTGRTTVDSKQGPVQPQGRTGPIDTQSGGAPAESPQGQSPPGMQAAPEGSSKTIVDPKR